MKTFKEVRELVEEIDNLSEKAYDKNDVRNVQKLEKKLQAVLKDVDKTMRGSGLSAPAFAMVRGGVRKSLEAIEKFYKIAKGSKESVQEETTFLAERIFKATLDFDMGNPREYSDEWEDDGVYIDTWDKRKNELVVMSKDKRGLEKWLVDVYGLAKREVRGIVK